MTKKHRPATLLTFDVTGLHAAPRSTGAPAPAAQVAGVGAAGEEAAGPEAAAPNVPELGADDAAAGLGLLAPLVRALLVVPPGPACCSVVLVDAADAAAAAGAPFTVSTIAAVAGEVIAGGSEAQT